MNHQQIDSATQTKEKSQPPFPSVQIALVHDWLNQMGGAENVLEELVGLFPQAPIYTSMYAPEQMPDAYRGWPIHTSFMQRLPAVTTHHQMYLPLYPLAFERTNLSGYDLVISNKSGFCHGVRTAYPGAPATARRAIHLCYCLTPTRYLWLFDQYREREQIGRFASAAMQPLLARLRKWDYAAAQRVDHFVAISREVQQRIKTIYHRTSVIIHPPVNTDYFSPAPTVAPGDYYLIVSRLIPYKRIDLAIQAFRHLPSEKLLIVGDGRDRQALAAHASANVQFLGRLPRAEVRDLLRGCKAFLFPGLEDFGIAPLEANSVGRPVIAFAGGGALDTIQPGINGELFQTQNVESLLSVLQQFRPSSYDPVVCRRQAETFSRANFGRKLVRFIEQVITVNNE